MRVGDARHDGVKQRRRGRPVTRGQQSIEPQFPVHRPVGTCTPVTRRCCSRSAFRSTRSGLEIGRVGLPAGGLDDLLGDLFGREQARLTVVGDARLQVLAGDRRRFFCNRTR